MSDETMAVIVTCIMVIFGGLVMYQSTLPDTTPNHELQRNLIPVTDCQTLEYMLLSDDIDYRNKEFAQTHWEIRCHG